MNGWPATGVVGPTVVRAEPATEVAGPPDGAVVEGEVVVAAVVEVSSEVEDTADADVDEAVAPTRASSPLVAMAKPTPPMATTAAAPMN